MTPLVESRGAHVLSGAHVLVGLALASGVGLASPPAAQAQEPARAVVALVAADDGLREPLELELEQRGLSTVLAPPSESRDAATRREEARVAAQAVGGAAAIFVDVAPDGATAIVWAVRADLDLAASSPIPLAVLRVAPRVAALVAAALVEELLARAAPSPRATTLRREDAPPTPSAPPAPATTAAQPRVYGWLAHGGYLRTSPALTGGMIVRAGAGREWPSGLRLGGTLTGSAAGESGMRAAQYVSGPAIAIAAGVDVALRVSLPGHAIHVGGHVLVGVARHLASTSEDFVPGALGVAGGFVAVTHAIGPDGEMGLRIDVDAWLESERGLTPSVQVSLLWGWR